MKIWAGLRRTRTTFEKKRPKMLKSFLDLSIFWRFFSKVAHKSAILENMVILIAALDSSGKSSLMTYLWKTWKISVFIDEECDFAYF